MNGVRDKAEQEFTKCKKDCLAGNPLKGGFCLLECVTNFSASSFGADSAEIEGLSICAVRFACCMEGKDFNSCK